MREVKWNRTRFARATAVYQYMSAFHLLINPDALSQSGGSPLWIFFRKQPFNDQRMITNLGISTKVSERLGWSLKKHWDWSSTDFERTCLLLSHFRSGTVPWLAERGLYTETLSSYSFWYKIGRASKWLYRFFLTLPLSFESFIFRMIFVLFSLGM